METRENNYRVGAVVVTYGSRVQLLSQTVEAILKDNHVRKLIIVDNASSDKNGIDSLTSKYSEKVRVIIHDQNLGSAGGFAAGIRAVREEAVDYVYLSDDDVVISENFVEGFKHAHKVIGNDQTVLLSRRASFWAGTDVHYHPETEPRPRKYFNVLSPRIGLVFLKSLLGMQDKHVPREQARFFPIVPSRGWAYAGVLLPVEAAKRAPLPDETLGLYLDDIVYSWGVIDSGFPSFALTEPHLEDLEMTHSGSQTATGLFSSQVSPTKVYYETRNRVRVSLKYGKANRTLLRLQVFVWYMGVIFLGFMRHGIKSAMLARAGLIREALRAGFDATRSTPTGIAVRV
jgi:GT2 family glycosyltransferase